MTGINEQLDSIFDEIDDLLLAEDFEGVELILRGVDILNTDTTLLLGYLTITLVAAEDLPYRAGFFNAVKSHLQSIEPDRVDALLKGLEATPKEQP